MRDQLLRLLTTYEGAVQEANDSPDDDVAVQVLEDARQALMNFLIPIRAELDNRRGDPK